MEEKVETANGRKHLRARRHVPYPQVLTGLQERLQQFECAGRCHRLGFQPLSVGKRTTGCGVAQRGRRGRFRTRKIDRIRTPKILRRSCQLPAEDICDEKRQLVRSRRSNPDEVPSRPRSSPVRKRYIHAIVKAWKCLRSDGPYPHLPERVEWVDLKHDKNVFRRGSDGKHRRRGALCQRRPWSSRLKEPPSTTDQQTGRSGGRCGATAQVAPFFAITDQLVVHVVTQIPAITTNT